MADIRGPPASVRRLIGNRTVKSWIRATTPFEEEIKGSLTRGKLADFVLLERDPHAVDPLSIVDIRVVRTVMGGRTTYEA